MVGTRELFTVGGFRRLVGAVRVVFIGGWAAWLVGVVVGVAYGSRQLFLWNGDLDRFLVVVVTGRAVAACHSLGGWSPWWCRSVRTLGVTLFGVGFLESFRGTYTNELAASRPLSETQEGIWRRKNRASRA